MSEWYEPKREDMDVDGDEINIRVGSNYNGAVWIAVKIADILDTIKAEFEKK